MSALQPSFMLPTKLLFPPNGRIKLGAVLGEGKNGLPDPEIFLNAHCLKEPTSFDTINEPTFHYDGNDKLNTKTGFWIDLASLVEIGIAAERGHDNFLTIDTGAVSFSLFTPSVLDIRNLMADDFLSEYTKRPRCQPVYLVTGIMIAQDATVEVHNTTTSLVKAKVVVSADGFGYAIRAGPDFERDASKTVGPKYSLTQPFVLAYQLVRVQKRKLHTSYTSKAYLDHALWDDNQSTSTDEWEVEAFTAEHDPNWCSYGASYQAQFQR